ncbi:hypothetical protein ACFY71_35930 [Streptomyces cinerochromogenes]|uniref:hypothetical protein n=1 Tax=Streptomyces cinerochromogenes TaxID=66422 RepID=UPI0036AB36F4
MELLGELTLFCGVTVRQGWSVRPGFDHVRYRMAWLSRWCRPTSTYCLRQSLEALALLGLVNRWRGDDLNLLLDLHDGPHMGDRPASASMISTKVCAAQFGPGREDSHLPRGGTFLADVGVDLDAVGLEDEHLVGDRSHRLAPAGAHRCGDSLLTAAAGRAHGPGRYRSKGQLARQDQTRHANPARRRPPRRAGHRNGIYLIAFFTTDQWTAKERKRPAAGQTPAGLKETYDAQAAQLNESRNLNVRAFVLDCTIRSSAQRNT